MKVLNEEETIEKLKQGYSLARFGDGEVFNIMINKKGIVDLQEFDLNLQKKLFNVLYNPVENLLIGIPNLDYKKPWVKTFHTRFEKIIAGKDCEHKSIFASAFFSRPSVVGKASKNYFNLAKSIWEDKFVVIVNFKLSIIYHDLFDIKNRDIVLIKRKHCFSEYDYMLKSCLEYNDCIFLISAGPTATCLAYDLTKHGRQAIDIGQLALEYSIFNNEYDLKDYTSQDIYNRKT